MIRTQCAACAAPLPDLAKQCSRCKTRYCGSACQEQHWKEGGHDKLCKKIRKGGGAEQHYADKKYKEAVAVAFEKCAEDTKGQTCYICTEAVHRRTKEGLVRGCACHTTEGFVHMSCLAEQGKILIDEAEENNLDDKAFNTGWNRWHTCSLCEKRYHGVVLCALGWACWKTYVGRPEADELRGMAMGQLGNGLSDANHHADALSVQEAELSLRRRLGASEHQMLIVQSNLATTYEMNGRINDALQLEKDAYSGHLRLFGEENTETLGAAHNYAGTLKDLKRFEEAKSVLRKTLPVARRVLGDFHEITLRMRSCYAQTLYKDYGATLDDLRKAVTTLEDLARTRRRVLGGAHPSVAKVERTLQESRVALGAREDASSLRRVSYF